MNARHHIAAIAMVFAASPSLASETPRPTAQDSRIREVVYSDAQVYRVVGVFRSATQIVFSSGERVEHVALGDTVSWEVAPAEIRRRDINPHDVYQLNLSYKAVSQGVELWPKVKMQTKLPMVESLAS